MLEHFKTGLFQIIIFYLERIFPLQQYNIPNDIYLKNWPSFDHQQLLTYTLKVAKTFSSGFADFIKNNVTLRVSNSQTYNAHYDIIYNHQNVVTDRRLYYSRNLLEGLYWAEKYFDFDSKITMEYIVTHELTHAYLEYLHEDPDHQNPKFQQYLKEHLTQRSYQFPCMFDRYLDLNDQPVVLKKHDHHPQRYGFFRKNHQYQQTKKRTHVILALSPRKVVE